MGTLLLVLACFGASVVGGATVLALLFAWESWYERRDDKPVWEWDK